MTYQKDLDLFYELYDCNARDLRRTITLLLGARKHPTDPKAYLRGLLGRCAGANR